MSDWRREAAADTLARYLEAVPVAGPALVLRDRTPRGAGILEEKGVRVRRWDRIRRPDVEVSPWPPEGPFATVVLRLPKAKDELEMLVHAAAARLEADGVLLVYGANDEGIRSVDRLIEPLLGAVDTVMRKNRCRVLRSERPAELSGLRGSLHAWRETWTLEVGEMHREWVCYPGVFAHGRLDAGTALLLRVLPAPEPKSRLLDFGCGSGILGGVLLDRVPSLEVDLLDVDAVALEAARANVPGARTILADGLGELEPAPYDWIVSNPPYHASKAETLQTVERLIGEAPRHLSPGGTLAFVVQRRLPIEEHLEAGFGSVESPAEDGTYRVWMARHPLSGRSTRVEPN